MSGLARAPGGLRRGTARAGSASWAGSFAGRSQPRARRVVEQGGDFLPRLGAAQAARREPFEDLGEVARQRVLEVQLFSGQRMLEGEPERVEELPLKAKACGRVLRGVRDVHEIAHERVARVLHVDADLQSTSV